MADMKAQELYNIFQDGINDPGMILNYEEGCGPRAQIFCEKMLARKLSPFYIYLSSPSNIIQDGIGIFWDFHIAAGVFYNDQIIAMDSLLYRGPEYFDNWKTCMAHDASYPMPEIAFLDYKTQVLPVLKASPSYNAGVPYIPGPRIQNSQSLFWRPSKWMRDNGFER